ncbi:methionyl-tRNA formyltransferase [Bifidobacterium aquikefiricola]|uniref:Methionyl-tRNA formyltransferase n=1 Tax=Bifidobacterium aquikefiricola TaxID=3059038 RepID=A0AB39U4T3_9BIFI
MKLLFAGTPEVAVPSLQALAADDDFEIVAVLTRPDAPQGRGRRLVASPVKQAAEQLKIPVLEANPSDSQFVDTLKSTGAEIAAVVAYGRILRENVLDALPFGWYNLHFSLLPQWRGAAPVQRAIWAGDSLSGATVFRITKGLDDGPIVAQSTAEIGRHETAGSLLNRLSIDGSHLLTMSLKAVVEGRARPEQQERGVFEKAEKITVEDAHIDFHAPGYAVERQIRACTPEPGAWGHLHDQSDDGEDGLLMHVLDAREATYLPNEMPQELQGKLLRPGELLTSKKHVWVGTLTKPLELRQVKLQGRKAMDAAAWARGARLTESAHID